MELDPQFSPQTVVHTAPEGLVALWLKACNQDPVESDVLRQSARGLIRLHRLEIDIEDQAIEQLAGQLRKPNLDLAARLPIARALVELDAKQYADLLTAQLPMGGRDMAEIVEPALACWQDSALRDQWLARLSDPLVSRRSLHLAIEGLGRLKDLAAQPKLEKIVVDRNQPLSIRLEAAKSLSKLCDAGLEPFVTRLLESPQAASDVGRLIAVLTLARHDSLEAQELFRKLARDDDSAVAAKAIEQLMRIKGARLAPPSSELLRSPDAELRLLSIQVIRRSPKSESVMELCELLDDEHLHVRRDATRALIELAQTSAAPRRAEICKQTASLLDVLHPRRTEHALVVLAKLDFDEAGSQILELLESHDASVSTTAAWALEQLAAPGTAEKILEHIIRHTDRSVKIVEQWSPPRDGGETPLGELAALNLTYERLEHLILALGTIRYQEADSFLRQFIPKPIYVPGGPPRLEVFSQPRTRAAAIWTLGKIYAGRREQAPADMVNAISERMADDVPIPREEPIVRRMAAISLGRIGASDALAQLRQFFDPAADHDELGRACGWAIEQITGEKQQLVTTRIIRHVDWFLVPLDP